jgi:hypothetical protein
VIWSYGVNEMASLIAWNDFVPGFGGFAPPVLTLVDDSGTPCTILQSLENLRTPQLGEFMRAQLPPGVIFPLRLRATWPTAITFSFSSLLNCNFQVGTCSFGGTYASGPALTTYPVGSNGYDRLFMRHLFAYVNPGVYTTYVEWTLGVQFELSPGVSSDIVDIGRFWVGRALHLDGVTLGLQTNLSYKFVDNARSVSTPGGQSYGNEPQVLRQMNFALQNAPKSLILQNSFGSSTLDSNIFDLLASVGTSREFIVIPRLTTPVEIYQMAIYGKMVDPTGPRHAKGDLWNVDFTAREVF